jgi:type I phosphodiesterase/nucleotide pyrophosphatase
VALRGLTAQGVIPHFPSTAAKPHVALFTGAYGNVNGISANSNPVAPRASPTFLERSVGFRSAGLTAESLWAAAARQGVKTVAYQVTQAYPFIPLNTAPSAPVPPVVVNGCQTSSIAPGHGP